MKTYRLLELKNKLGWKKYHPDLINVYPEESNYSFYMNETNGNEAINRVYSINNKFFKSSSSFLQHMNIVNANNDCYMKISDKNISIINKIIQLFSSSVSI